MRYLLVALLLTGCAATDKSARMDNRYGPTCSGLGFSKGTEQYSNCLLKMYHTDMATN